jgi:5-methylthioadenosine/S-adenosylhomocysteine deaminase
VRTLIRGGTLVTMNATRDVVVGDLLLSGTTIEAVAPKRVPEGPLRVIDATGCAVIPGLVQAHVHLCQVLFRGMADDLPLLDWLKQRIWPFEAAHTERSLAASARLGLLEMMLAGTTTILDMGTVHHHDEVMSACHESGIRAISGKTMMDRGDGVPRGLRESTRESLRESERLARDWHGKGTGLLGYAYAPRFILSCTEKLFREVHAMSTSAGQLLHTHASEHPGEKSAVRNEHGADDVDVFERWGILSERTVLAHGVQLTGKQSRMLAKRGVRITHCPSANLKLGSGIAPVTTLRKHGIIVALGADGAPCNNNLDPWIELRSAALLAKIKTGTTALPAREAFELATCDGAKALGLSEQIGSLEASKQADIAVVRLDSPHVEPGGDTYSRLVYACTKSDVEHVWVAGDHVVRQREHQRLDIDTVLRNARHEAPRLSARAKI